ncbi:MAG TPA: response regulator [Bryobacteraceae bacterium]|jgi:CheY-like chemotaxis protein|nr:response regulator [Bryobacteraceae bacterium]
MMALRRVLVIEDEYLIALEIESVLEEAGIGEIVLAPTESAALEEVTRGGWDAVVADANLNGVGIQRIVAALADRSIPFLIVTGYSREDLPWVIGNVPIVRKPFFATDLVEALEETIAAGAIART